jgi:hypothetical protein
MAAAAGAALPARSVKTCHDGRMEANHNHYETEAKKTRTVISSV